MPHDKARDQLKAWVDGVPSSSTKAFRALEEAVPELSDRLYALLRSTMAQEATDGSGGSHDPVVLVAPGRLRLVVGTESFETTTEGTLESIETPF